MSIHSILVRQIQFESITRLFLSKKGSANSVLLLAILYPKMVTKIFSNYISLFSLSWPFAFVFVFLKFPLLEGSFLFKTKIPHTGKHSTSLKCMDSSTIPVSDSITFYSRVTHYNVKKTNNKMTKGINNTLCIKKYKANKPLNLGGARGRGGGWMDHHYASATKDPEGLAETAFN